MLPPWGGYCWVYTPRAVHCSDWNTGNGYHTFIPVNSPGVLLQSFLTQLLPFLTERNKSCYPPHTQLCQGCVTCPVPLPGVGAQPLSSHLQLLHAFVLFTILASSREGFGFTTCSHLTKSRLCVQECSTKRAGSFGLAAAQQERALNPFDLRVSSVLEAFFSNDSLCARKCYKLRQEFVAQVCENFFIVS